MRVIKYALVFCLIFSFLLSCEEENKDKTTFGTIEGYIYAPKKEIKNNQGLLAGLFFCESVKAPPGFEPVTGAKVNLLNVWYTTSKEGFCKFSNIPAGIQCLTINASGYQPAVQRVIISALNKGAVTSLAVVPQSIVVVPGEAVYFMAAGENKLGELIKLDAIKWIPPKGGQWQGGVFIADKPGRYKVIANLDELSKEAEVVVWDPTSQETATVTGKVVNLEGKGAMNSPIIVDALPIMGITDNKGEYKLLNLPAGVLLNIFVLHNKAYVSTGVVQLEKWKGKSLDFAFTFTPPQEPSETPVPLSASSGSENIATTKASGYLYQLNLPENKDLPFVLYSQSKLYSTDLLPLSKVNVSIEELPEFKTTTGEDGMFQFTSLPLPGEEPYSILVVWEDNYFAFPFFFQQEEPEEKLPIHKISLYPKECTLMPGEKLFLFGLGRGRKDEIVFTPQLSWHWDGEIGKFEEKEQVFTAETIGEGKMEVTYGDIKEELNIKIIPLEDTGTLKGEIKDPLGTPLSGLVVKVPGIVRVGVTDSKGAFSIKGIPWGEKVPLEILKDGKVISQPVAAITKGQENTKQFTVTIPTPSPTTSQPAEGTEATPALTPPAEQPSSVITPASPKEKPTQPAIEKTSTTPTPTNVGTKVKDFLRKLFVRKSPKNHK